MFSSKGSCSSKDLCRSSAVLLISDRPPHEFFSDQSFWSLKTYSQVNLFYHWLRPAHHVSSSINKIAPCRSLFAARNGAQVMRHWIALPRRFVASNKTSV